MKISELIPAHSVYRSLFLNNAEKDCVIAYIENDYIIAFLIKIKGKENFKGFVYLKSSLIRKITRSFFIEEVSLNELKKTFDNDKGLKIVEDKEYQKLNNLLIINELEKE